MNFLQTVLIAIGLIVAACGGGWVLFQSKAWKRFAASPLARQAGELLLLAAASLLVLLPAAGPQGGDNLERFAALPGLAVVLGGILLKSSRAKVAGAIAAAAGLFGVGIWLRLGDGDSFAEAAYGVGLPMVLVIAAVSVVMMLLDRVRHPDAKRTDRGSVRQ